jgi:2-methylisocitrate lyase-like PEP mutase family enzyme
MTTPAATLRRLLEGSEIIVVPGGGSPLELRLIEQAGFQAGYVSGYATAAARYALPDIGLVAYGEIEDMIRATRQVTDLPLIVDCDTGYGDVANVRRTVRGMEGLGVAAVQIEDQSWPKRCGHMEGKIVEPAEIAVRKIDAALAARREDIVIVARTDARGPHGIEEAVRRCRRFREIGADVIFVDGPESLEELKIIARDVDAPLLANMSETGKTPLLSAAELQTLGYKIALFPSSTVRLNIKIVSDFLASLKQSGDSRGWVDRMASLDATNAALGMTEIRAFEADILQRSKVS